MDETIAAAQDERDWLDLIPFLIRVLRALHNLPIEPSFIEPPISVPTERTS